MDFLMVGALFGTKLIIVLRAFSSSHGDCPILEAELLLSWIGFYLLVD